MSRLYFFLMLIVFGIDIYFGFIYPFFSSNLMRTLVFMFSLIGLYGFVFRKVLLFKQAWLYLFLVSVAFTIFSLYSFFFSKAHTFTLLNILWTDLIRLPLYYALFQYCRGYYAVAESNRVLGSSGMEVMFAIGSIVAIILTCSLFIYISIDSSFREINELYKKKKYSQAYKKADNYINRYKFSDVSGVTLAKAYYFQGVILVRKNKIKTAKLKFRKIWSHYIKFESSSKDKRIKKLLLESRKIFYKNRIERKN